MMTSSDKKSKIFLKEKFVSIYETFFKVKKLIFLYHLIFFFNFKQQKRQKISV
jgi:hypothetical protein